MASVTSSILIRYGIDFTCYEPHSLKRRIIRVINLFDLHSVHALWLKFLRDPDFINTFMNEVSVGMTSMFRDPVLWRNLGARLQNEYTGKKSLSVWHAGCSTGEEVYTLGILLEELKLKSKAQALATDINSDAIEAAKAGSYHKIKMIENEANYRAFNPYCDFNAYFSTEGKYAFMNPELIEHTTFKYHNLITDDYSRGYDLIFCRNVMIYFDKVAKHKLLERFYNSLNPNGYLIIGFYDTMFHMVDSEKFALVDADAKIFQRI